MVKQLIELAVASGRKRQNKQTGFVHYCYHANEEEIHYPIPVLENVLFSLALMQTRMSDNVLEGKDLLEKILCFQQKNFPLYLHDFPKCHDHFLAIHLLPPFYWIMKHFQAILGQELKRKLEQAITQLIDHSLCIHEEKNLPYHFGVKLGASVQAVGELLNQKDWIIKGEQILFGYCQKSQVSAWFTPESIAEILIGLQMVYSNLPESPWKSFWEHLCQTWNREIGVYVGPGIKELQQEMQPQATLYDLYMGYFSGNYSKHALSEKAWHLQAILIQETSEQFPPVIYPLKYENKLENHSWNVFQNQNNTFSLIEKSKGFPSHAEVAFHPLKIIWGSSETIHSFVNQGGNADFIHYLCHPTSDLQEQKIEMIFTMAQEVYPEEKEKNKEIAFYFDVAPEAKILISGKPATTFQLDESIHIEYDHLKITLEFLLEEGEGQFFGHFMRGNRPAQLCLKGTHRFKSYDWQIFLRTVRRSSLCKIRAKIKVEYNK